MNDVPTKVLLPAWIFEQAKDNDEIRLLVLDYMTRYPNYRIIKVSGSFAVCEKLESFL
ncbi:hypothetical protein [Lysinibacillus sphaericus]|uniref:hypothetical protein n=1 Tax=Lysinibacillus sphaericus TaxID=1421 RepID=UPI000ACEA779|nr:hypothetical protein [Lysinibacillus sphaericus]QPA60659.1 hypothetical protein INQ55_10165 [Lysinibacillus sphaericus]